MAKEKTSIVTEYLSLQKKYQKLYGQKTFLLYQVGSFAEAYSIDKTDTDFLRSVCSQINLILTRKNKADPLPPSLKNTHRW